MKTTKLKVNILERYPLLKNKRSLVWRKVKGLWKTRQPNPLSELTKIRKEWN